MTIQTTEIKLAKQYKKVIFITDTALLFIQWLLIAWVLINNQISDNAAIVFIVIGGILLLLVIIKQIKTKALAMGIIDNLFLIWTIPIGLISIIPYKIYQNELTKLLFNKQTINQAPQRTMQQPQIFVNKKIGMSIASLAAAIFVFIEICSSADTAHMFIFIILLFGAMAYFHIYKLIIDNDKIIVKNISLFGSECVFNLKDIKSWQIKNNWLIFSYQDKKILKRCIYKGSTQQYKEIISLIKPTTDEI